MDQQALAARIAGHPLLEGLDEIELAVLAAHGSLVTRERSEVLLAQGEPADELVLLLEGKVSVLMRGERGFDHELATVEAGGTLGELGLLGGGERGATVKALEAVEGFVLPAAAIQEMLDERESAAIKLFERLARTIAGRLSTMNARLCALTDDQDHPDGTVQLKLSDIRERLLRAGATGL